MRGSLWYMKRSIKLNKMLQVFTIFTIIICTLTCSVNVKAESRRVEVKGLVLKYVLIDTAYEMYEVNVRKDKATSNVFSYESYSQIGEDSKKHYIWLTDSYKSMSKKNKVYLYNLFKDDWSWYFMNLTTKLDDSADVDDIIRILLADKEVKNNEKLKEAIEKFLPYFYTHYLKSYLHMNNKVFNKYTEDINHQIKKNNSDITGFMEQMSGIKFEKRYKPEFYYTLRPIGAFGFSYKDVKVSTIQRTCTDYKYLFDTPFHEYSHELFQTFTHSKEFNNLAKSLKKNKALYTEWTNGMNTSYDWVGWCEENLVEGFSKYLSYKYFKKDSDASIYPYDKDFYKYLKDKNFDGKKDSLKEFSMDFYKQKLKDKE